MRDMFQNRINNPETFEKILDNISSYYNISKDKILGTSRRKDIKIARFILIYLLREMCDFSYPALGILLNRDHTTMLNAYRRVNNEYILKSKYIKDIENLKKIIGTAEVYKFKFEPNKQKDELELKQPKFNFEKLSEIIKKDEMPKVQQKKKRKEKIIKSIHDIPPLTKENNKQKLELVLNLWRSGYTCDEIAKHLNLSRQRANDLIKKGLLILDVKKLVSQGMIINFNHYYLSEKNKQIIIRKKRKGLPEIPAYKIKKPKKIKRWSTYYDKCRFCGTTEIKHRCNGYCTNCYYKSNEFKEIQRSSRFNNIEKRKIAYKKYYKEYSKRTYVIEKQKKINDEIHFDGKRELTILRDGSKCRICGITRQASNKKYKKDLFVKRINVEKGNDFKNLITLCQGCFTKEKFHKTNINSN